MYNKILITGQMRSGTTFLSNFLNAQDEITIYSDIFHVVAGKILSQPVKTTQIPYNKNLSSSEKEEYLKLVNIGLKMLGDKTDYVLEINPSQFDTPKELYNLLLNSINYNDNKVVGHKVTETEKNVKNLLLNTNVNVIYIVRDPRDQVLSSMKKFGYDIYTAVTKWKNGIKKILDINSDRLLIIKFENLINKSEISKNKLETFLNVNINYSVNKLKQHKKDFIGNSSFNDVNKVFDKKAISRWKNKNEFLVKYIFLMTINLINKLGYESMNYNTKDIERKEKINNLLIQTHELKKKINNNKLEINNLLESKISKFKL